MFRASRMTKPSACLLALLTPLACGEDAVTQPMEDNIQTVTVTPTNLQITGSCDHDSIFEGSSDGEFTFSFTVTPTGGSPRSVWTADNTYEEQNFPINNLSTTFNRNVTVGEDFAVEITGTEFDGVLGPDPDFSSRAQSRGHQFSGNAWGEETETISLSGLKSQCGAVLSYAITTAAAG